MEAFQATTECNGHIFRIFCSSFLIFCYSNLKKKKTKKFTSHLFCRYIYHCHCYLPHFVHCRLAPCFLLFLRCHCFVRSIFHTKCSKFLCFSTLIVHGRKKVKKKKWKNPKRPKNTHTFSHTYFLSLSPSLRRFVVNTQHRCSRRRHRHPRSFFSYMLFIHFIMVVGCSSENASF